MASPLSGAAACVFDAYGTLLDTSSAAARAKDALGERGQALADLWRSKQLQYTWLRSLMGRHADFRQVTEDALAFAMETLGVADAALAARLMDEYQRLDAFPEVPRALERLRRAGVRLAILSNGTPGMLASSARHGGIAPLLEAILSVEEVGIYKPSPRVYQLAVDRLGVAADRILFVSANGWDAFAAKAFGVRVAWCNRAGQPPERIPEPPDVVVRDLSELAGVMGVG